MSSFENELQSLIGNSDEGGISKAEAEVLKELLNEKNPLFKSEISDYETVPFVSAWAFAEQFNLKIYKEFLDKFLKTKVPRKRLRVNEIIRAMRKDKSDDLRSESIWHKMTKPRI